MKQQPSQMQSGIPEYSLDIVMDLMKERAVGQSDQITALDTKANTILGIATTIMGTALVLQAVLFASPSHLSTPTYSFSQKGLLILLIIYLVTMLTAAFSGYWVSNYQRVPEPSQLLTYVAKPPQETKETIIGTMAEAFEYNKRILKKKVWGTRIAMITFGGEVVALVILLALQIVS